MERIARLRMELALLKLVVKDAKKKVAAKICIKFDDKPISGLSDQELEDEILKLVKEEENAK